MRAQTSVPRGCHRTSDLHRCWRCITWLLLAHACVLQDEVDSLGQSRGSNTDSGARRLLTELLIQFTRAAGEEGVYVFGATNRMQVCACVLSLTVLAQQMECLFSTVCLQRELSSLGCLAKLHAWCAVTHMTTCALSDAAGL